MGGSTYYCDNTASWQQNTGDDINKIISKIERSYLSTSVLSSNDVVFAKGDSAATSHYIRIEDSKKCLKDIQKYDGLPVMLPDAGKIAPTLQSQLLLSNKLSMQSQRATSLPALKSLSLISLGQLCNDNCTIVLDKTKMLVIKEDEIILRGHRNYLDGLWDIPIKKTRI